MSSLTRIYPAREPIADHEQKKVALGYVHEAWAEARLDGVDGDCMAQACLFAALIEFVTAERAACAAVGRAASIPFAAQLTVASNPIPTARTATRRRQYVAGETLAGWRRGPRGWSARPRGL